MNKRDSYAFSNTMPHPRGVVRVGELRNREQIDQTSRLAAGYRLRQEASHLTSVSSTRMLGASVAQGQARDLLLDVLGSNVDDYDYNCDNPDEFVGAVLQRALEVCDSVAPARQQHEARGREFGGTDSDMNQ